MNTTRFNLAARTGLGLLALMTGLGLAQTARAQHALSQGPLAITFKDSAGQIDSLKFEGAELYRVGTFVSDWGLQAASAPGSFAINANRDASPRIPMTLALDGGSFLSYAGVYTNGGLHITVTRTYRLVAGQNALQTLITLQNTGPAAAALWSFDTFDPDYAPAGGEGIRYTTANDRYPLPIGSMPAKVGCATQTNGVTALLGATDPLAVIGASKTNSFSIYTASDLSAFFAGNGADSEGAISDTSLDIAWQVALDPGVTRSLEYFHCFGASPVEAETAFFQSVATNVPPAIVVEPSSQTTSDGGSATLSVLASGSAPLSYQWYFKEAPLGLQTNSLLAFDPVGPGQAGDYFVIITNQFGGATSQVAHLIVHSGAPVIDEPPASVDTISGTSVAFHVAASGTVPLGYQWRHNSTNIADATQATLTLHNLTAADAGAYDVIVSNSHGSVTSRAAALTITVVGGPPDLEWASGGHSAEINSVAFSPDGTLLASACDDLSVKLWRVSDGALVRTLFGHGNDVRAAAFSPDGTRLVSGGKDGRVLLWEVASGAVLWDQAHFDVRSVAWAPDGSMVASAAGNGDSTVAIWRASDGLRLRTIGGHSGDVRSVAYAPDGATLVSGDSNGSLRFWRTADWQLLVNVPVNTNIFSVAYSPNGLFVAAGLADNTAKLFDPATGGLVRTLSGHTDSIRWVAFSPDASMLASGSWDSRIKLWNPATGALLRTINDGERVRTVAFSPGGAQLAVGNKGFQVRLRQVSNGALLRTFTENLAPISAQAFSPDGTLLAVAAGDNSVKVWRVAGRTLLRSFNGAASALAFSHDGALLAGGSLDTSINLWSLATGQVVQTLYGHEEGVLALGFSPDDRQIYSVSFDDSIKQWTVESGVLEDTIGLRPFEVSGAAFPPGGSLVAVSFLGGATRLMSLPEGAVLAYLTDNAYSSGSSLTFSADGSQLAAWAFHSFGPLQVFGVPGGTPTSSFATYPDGTNAPTAFSPDGLYLASAQAGVLTLWRLGTHAVAQYYDQQIGTVLNLAFSPTGAHVAIGRADGTVLLARHPFGALRVTGFRRIGSQSVLEWAGGGGPYQLQSRTNLSTDTWKDVGTPTWSLRATNVTADPTRFFQVRRVTN